MASPRVSQAKEKILTILHHRAAAPAGLAVLIAVTLWETFFPHAPAELFQVMKPENIMPLFGPATSMQLTGFAPGIVCVWIFNYFVVAWLGWALLSLHPALKTFLFIERWVGGFWLGYIATCALARVWACFTTGMTFYVFCLVTVISLILCSLRGRAPGPSRNHVGFSFFSILVAMAVGIGSMLQLVYFGPFRWVGHGYNQYARHMLDWDSGIFPIVDQHYDEFIFHHFLTAPFFSLTTNALLPWWITLGLIKVSTFVFLVMAARVLDLKRGSSLLLTLFLFLGTVSLPPSSYYMLFDSSHPLFFTVHSGRVIGIPLFIFAFLALRDSVRLPIWAQALLGGGIVASTMSNCIWIFLLIGFFTLRRMPDREMENDSRISLVASPLLYILPHPIIGFWPKVMPALSLWPKLIPLVFHFKNSSWVESAKGGIRSLAAKIKASPLNVFLIGAVSFILLFGNMLATNPMARLFRSTVSFFGGNLVLEKLAPADYTGLTGRVGEIFYDQRELADYIYYNETPFTFLAVYGGLFLIIGLCLLTLRQRQGQLRNDETESRLFCFLVFLLPFIFVFVDFFGYGVRGWVRARFLEIPFYAILFLATILLLRHGSKRARFATRAFLILFTVAPFVLSGRITQLQLNFELLRSLFGR